MVLLHCSLAHSGAWEGVARALADSRCLTAPDLAGHGRAPDWDTARDLHDQSTETARAALPEGAFDLVGHSYGATVALRLALEMPGRVRSLALIEPVLFAAAKNSGAFAAAWEKDQDFAALLARGDRESAARDFIARWGGGAPYDALPARQQTYIRDRIHLIGGNHPALFQDSAGLLPRLRDLAPPLLLIEGGLRPPVMGATLDAFQKAVPSAARVTVPGAGHMVPVTHPAPVAAALKQHAVRSGQGERRVDAP